MPTVRAGDIRGVYAGTREAGAMLMGDRLVWNKTALYTRTDNSAPSVPDWATFFTVILVGGGAGGQAGDGGNRAAGVGGRAGNVHFVSDSIQPGSRLTLSLGRGGVGGSGSSRALGRSGGSTGMYYYKYGSSSRSFIEARGGSNRMSSQMGGSTTLSPNIAGRYYQSHTGRSSSMTIGHGPSGNGHNGSNGAGGSGGNGGIFNNYSSGGRGGDGWFQIQFYGVDPLAYRPHT